MNRQTSSQPNSRASKSKGSHLKGIFNHIRLYFIFLWRHLRTPAKPISQNNPLIRRYGFITYLLLSLFTGLALGQFANHIYASYSWISTISILPIINMPFNPVLSYFQFLLLAFLLYATLPLIIFIVYKYVCQQKMHFLDVAAEFYSLNVVTLLIAFATWLIVTLQALVFLGLILIFFAIIMINLVVTTTSFYHLNLANQENKKIYYSLLTSLTHTFLIIILFSVIF